MRSIFVILIVAVAALIAAIQLGLISITQTQSATAPSMTAVNGAIRAEAGQVPEFKVETGKVELGTREANVAIPKVEVTKDKATVNVPAVEVQRAGEPAGNAN